MAAPVHSGDQLGAGDLVSKLVVAVATVACCGLLTPVAGASHVVAFGLDQYGELGVMPSSAPDRCREEPCAESPVNVAGLKNVIAVSEGVFDSVALRANGTVLTWGDDEAGQLGDGGTETDATPKPVEGLSNVKSIASGEIFNLALTKAGVVFEWGGDFGSRPTEVPGLSEVKAIAAGGSHALALLKRGTVVAWGVNEHGQLGDGTREGTATPVAVAGLTHVRAIAAGWEHSLALLASGEVMAWGWNRFGQLGDGHAVEESDVPIQVPSLAGVRAIAAGTVANLALKTDGTVWGWGRNEYGEVGDGTLGEQASPSQAAGIAGAQSVSLTGGSSFAKLADGSVLAWGRNEYGELGDGSTAEQATATEVPALNGATHLAGGIFHGLAVVPGRG